MASYKFKLHPDTAKALDAARSALADDLEDQQIEFDERSGSWQQGDTGIAVSAWVKTLNDLVNELDAVEDRPEP